MNIIMLCAALLFFPAVAVAEMEGDNGYLEPPEIAEAAVENSHTNEICDDRGRARLIQKPDGGFSEYFYHPTLNKVSAVVTDKMSTVFTYSKDGNLIRAFNTQNQLITLGYDAHKHINRMIEFNKDTGVRRELTFKYNALGKPTEIAMKGKGEIRIAYNPQGEISKVASKQGAKMALAVTEAFQVLLQVVKAGGVDM